MDYTVAGVPLGHEAEYYVRILVQENGNTHILHEFLNDSTLREASNGTFRVTWDSALEGSECHFLDKAAAVRFELINCGNDRSGCPYGEKYLIVDLSGGASATSYPVEVRYYDTVERAIGELNTTEHKTTKLVLRRVKAGIFMMGSPSTEWSRQSNNTYFNDETLHQVTLTEDYYLGIFEVTQAQYLRVMGVNPSGFYTDAADNPAAERPVEKVSYANIRGKERGIGRPADFGQVDEDSFCGRLKARTGLAFDLPTEAQWEYACRAGTATATYAGDFNAGQNAVVDGIAWYRHNAGSTTHAVGRKTPNAWGFYDTIGNVWECCRDRVKVPCTDKFDSSAVVDPLGNGGNNMVARGGTWCDDATTARAACRDSDSGMKVEQDLSNAFGFRVSCAMGE